MWEHVESSSSTIKTIISSLPQRLWLLTRQDGELLWGATTYKVTWPRDRVVFGDHVTKQNHYVNTTTLPMVTKLDRVVPYLEALLSKIWHDSWITWSSKITWQTITIFPPPVFTTTKSGRLMTYHKVARSRDKLGFWYTVRSSHPLTCLVPQWGVIATSLI